MLTLIHIALVIVVGIAADEYYSVATVPSNALNGQHLRVIWVGLRWHYWVSYKVSILK